MTWDPVRVLPGQRASSQVKTQVMTWAVDLGPRLASQVTTWVLTWETGKLTWAVDLDDLV
jgi:hypothetical protein